MDCREILKRAMTKAIDFEKPPVMEVVCGVGFVTLKDIKAPHFGRYWKTIPDSFTRVEEAPPVVLSDASYSYEFSDIPPLPRMWFLTENEQKLIQVQRDRFWYNWKRPSDKIECPYPEYNCIFPEFLEQLSGFENFIKDEKLGSVERRQFELTYVNHIPKKSIQGVLPTASDVLVDHVLKADSDRFLPEPSTFRWASSYVLPESLGKMHVTAQTAHKRDGDDEEVIRVDLNVRGVGEDTSDKGMTEWFSVAHEWITKGFVDITDSKVQNEVWGRK